MSSTVDQSDESVGLGWDLQPTQVWQSGQSHRVQDRVAQEVPVALIVNGISHAVMMASPMDLRDFALGFALTEGIVDRLDQVYDCQVVRHSSEAVQIELEVAARCELRLKERKRSLSGRTGCGLCGVERLDMLQRDNLSSSVHAPEWQPEMVATAMSCMRGAQPVQGLTGATHAAAWFDLQGRLVLIREDVGRHNALDKLIGALKQASVPVQQGWVGVTSRASFEMVQKTVTLGAGLLVAVSGPTTYAIARAKEHGLTLVGYARGERMVVYS